MELYNLYKEKENNCEFNFCNTPLHNKIFKANNFFITSDLHFGHKNIIKYCNRKNEKSMLYSNADEMDQDIIRIWNENIPIDSDVFILGDIAFSLSKNKIKKYLDKMNGRKYLVMGNHDDIKSLPIECFEHISMIDNITIMDFDGEKNIFTNCILSHYPLLVWSGCTKGTFNLFGHVHGNISNSEYMLNQMDIGWDTFGKPYSWKDICEKFTIRILKNDGRPIKGF